MSENQYHTSALARRFESLVGGGDLVEREAFRDLEASPARTSASLIASAACVLSSAVTSLPRKSIRMFGSRGQDGMLGVPTSVA
jgi:hypothetical protein